MSLINIREILRDLIIFIISSISSFQTIDVFVSERNIFFWIPEPAADAATVNLNGIKTLLANDVSIFFINGKLGFIDGPKSLPRNPPHCIILECWVFDNFILADELFAKGLWKFVIICYHYLKSVVINSCGKLVSPVKLPIIIEK